MNPEITIALADLADAPEILALQKLAYQDEAAIYDDYHIPPLTQTLAEMQADLQNQVVLKAIVAGGIVGSVRAHMQHETCLIGRLIVHPAMQGRGIGTRLLQAIEAHFAQAARYELFTGHRSERNLHLYARLGYRPCRHTRLNERLTLIFLEKHMGDHYRSAPATTTQTRE